MKKFTNKAQGKNLIILPVGFFILAIILKIITLGVSDNGHVFIRMRNNTGVNVDRIFLGNYPNTKQFSNLGSKSSTKYIKIKNEFSRYSTLQVITADNETFTYFLLSNKAKFERFLNPDNSLKPGYYTFSISFEEDYPDNNPGIFLEIIKDNNNDG